MYGSISLTSLKAVRLPVVVSGQTKGSAARVSRFVKGRARGHLKGSDTKDTVTSTFYPLQGALQPGARATLPVNVIDDVHWAVGTHSSTAAQISPRLVVGSSFDQMC